MNREIKFRAWYKDIKEMFEVGQITLKKGIWDYQPEDRKYIGISIPYQPSFILMQFTGLHDKNGKEIYEGDIVKINYEYQNNFNPFVAEVKYSEKYAQFVIVGTGQVRHEYEELGDYIDYDLEVIGNIYENSELLGGE